MDIERELLEHPNIAEIAVCGVPDDVWGERVGAIVRLKDAQNVGSIGKYGIRLMFIFPYSYLLMIFVIGVNLTLLLTSCRPLLRLWMIFRRMPWGRLIRRN